MIYSHFLVRWDLFQLFSSVSNPHFQSRPFFFFPFSSSFLPLLLSPDPTPIVMRPRGLKVMGWQWRPGLRFNRPWLGELDPVEETGTGPKRLPIGPPTRDIALSLVKTVFQKSRDWPNNSYHVLRHAIRRSFV